MKKLLNDIESEIKKEGKELKDRVKNQIMPGKINQKLKFKSDNGYIYYSEFVYKIFKYKYKNLTRNIF